MKPPAILKTPLSAVRNVRQTKTHPLTFEDAVKEITGQKNAAVVSEIRRLKDIGQAAEAKTLKKTLPAILFAGTFSRRNNDGLNQHSGLLVIDFDDCGTELKQSLAADPYAVLCFVSPGGNGLKLVIRITPASNAEEHGESFDLAKGHFLKKYALTADPSGRDVCRLCFVSHDPDAIFKPEGEVLHRPYRQHMTIQDNEDNECKVEVGEVFPPSPRTVEEILSMTQPTQPGQRHRQIFNLARGLAFDCGLKDKPLPELKLIVRRWFDMAKPKIGTQVFDESWSDFVHAWPRVKTPLSTNALTAAWDEVQSGNLPHVAQEYEDPRTRNLVGLCWHLGGDAESFYLSTHKAGPLLGVKPMQVLRWMRMLQADEVISLVKPGNQSKANTYQWTNQVAKY